jgi:histidinol dehydrogenase
MSPKPTRSDDKQIELPVLEEVVDADHERARLMAALDELARLVDRVPKPGTALSEDEIKALKDELNAKLIEMFDEMAERMKHVIPKMVEKTLREHLKK